MKDEINFKFLILGIKIIIQNLKPYKNFFILLSVIGILGSIANSFIPFLTGKFFDALIFIYNTKILNFNSISLILILWLILKMINNLSDWYLGINLEKVGTIVEAKYISSAFKCLTELPLYFHKEKKQGEIVNKIQQAASWISNIVINTSLTIIIEFLTLILALILTFLINYKLSLILVITILIYIYILLKTAPKLAYFQKQTYKFYSQAYGDMYDKIQNISEIKQYSMEEYEQKKFIKSFFIWRLKRG